MARHLDKRLRLTRTDRGYEMRSAGSRPANGRYENECHCAMPSCTWTPAKQRETERGYQRRKGEWRTADGRFTLQWDGNSSVPTGPAGSHPNGWLRMWDSLLLRETYHTGISAARVEMAKRYDASGITKPKRRGE